MRRTQRVVGVLAVLTCATLLLSSCGDSDPAQSAGQGSGQSAASTPSGAGSATVGACTADSTEVRDATLLTRADLDGDGSPEEVRLTGSGGACPSMVFAKVGESYVAGQVPVDSPPVSEAFAVAVPGVGPDLLVTRQQHPRGGYQIRIFSLSDNTLVEARDKESPLVKFIATDVQEHPLSIDCTKGGLVLIEALAHEPRGVIFAWDVFRKTYAVASGAVTLESTKEIADNVLPAQLEKKFPRLADYSLFKSCRVGG